MCGALAKGTSLPTDSSLSVVLLFDKFVPTDYFPKHLDPIQEALTSSGLVRSQDVMQRGLSLRFVYQHVTVSVSAGGMLEAGSKQLLVEAVGKVKGKQYADLELQPKAQEWLVHVETSCVPLRVAFVAMQCLLYKSLVRVAKKWVNECEFMNKSSRPGEFLIELLMLNAFQGAPVMDKERTDELCGNVFRRFLGLLARKSASTGGDVLGDHEMPGMFISWDVLYNRGAIDAAIANGMLRAGDGLVIVDPSVPGINVAESVKDWGEVAGFAREFLGRFENYGVVEELQARVEKMTREMGETLKEMKKKVEMLEELENSPRRWSGVVQFKENHITGEMWALVKEVELRNRVWRINARKARSVGVGYSTKVDVSLQMMGDMLTRSIDVDVSFRGGTANLVFGPEKDHVLITTNSDVLRNRDYTMQVTVVA